MTRQQAFDFVWERISQQGQPSWQDGVGCLYRGPNGLKCAIGWLISDDDYKPSLESKCPTDPRFPRLPSLKGLPRDFLECMQDCHDTVAGVDPLNFVQEFQQNMIRLANREGLKCPA